MDWYFAGLEAMGSFGRVRHKAEGIAYSLPVSIRVLVIGAFLLAFLGVAMRFRAILAGEGTSTDFIGIMIMLVLLVMAVLIVGSGALVGIRFF